MYAFKGDHSQTTAHLFDGAFNESVGSFQVFWTATF